MPDYMLPYEVSEAFQERGWVRGSGGDLYFDGNGGSKHPHFHLRLDRNQPVRKGRDIRLAVGMFAWSDGQQHRGGGGRTFISNGQVRIQNWQQFNALLHMNGEMAEEFAYIMGYFTLG